MVSSRPKSSDRRKGGNWMKQLQHFFPFFFGHCILPQCRLSARGGVTRQTSGQGASHVDVDLVLLVGVHGFLECEEAGNSDRWLCPLDGSSQKKRGYRVVGPRNRRRLSCVGLWCVCQAQLNWLLVTGVRGLQWGSRSSPGELPCCQGRERAEEENDDPEGRNERIKCRWFKGTKWKIEKVKINRTKKIVGP